MTHIYRHPIQVTLADGKPDTIVWRGVTYRVLHLNEPWRLMDRWWEPFKAPETTATGNSNGVSQRLGDGLDEGQSDRTYYRVRCVSTHEDLTCEIYFEAIGGIWMLERVYD